jgi:hypothetical protein
LLKQDKKLSEWLEKLNQDKKISKWATKLKYGSELNLIEENLKISKTHEIDDQTHDNNLKNVQKFAKQSQLLSRLLREIKIIISSLENIDHLFPNPNSRAFFLWHFLYRDLKNPLLINANSTKNDYFSLEATEETKTSTIDYLRKNPNFLIESQDAFKKEVDEILRKNSFSLEGEIYNLPQFFLHKIYPKIAQDQKDEQVTSDSQPSKANIQDLQMLAKLLVIAKNKDLLTLNFNHKLNQLGPNLIKQLGINPLIVKNLITSRPEDHKKILGAQYDEKKDILANLIKYGKIKALLIQPDFYFQNKNKLLINANHFLLLHLLELETPQKEPFFSFAKKQLDECMQQAQQLLQTNPNYLSEIKAIFLKKTNLMIDFQMNQQGTTDFPDSIIELVKQLNNSNAL